MRRMGLFVGAMAPLLATAAMLGGPISTAAVGYVPAEVDATALGTSSSGPVIATGRLVDGHGRPATGSVAVTAWPGASYFDTDRVGMAIPTPTVGWATTGPDGSFSLRANLGALDPMYVNIDGVVNLTAVAWDGRSQQGQWVFPVHVPDAIGRVRSASGVTPAAPATPSITIPLARKIVTRATLLGARGAGKVGTGAASGVAPNIGGIPCAWWLQSTYNANVTLADSWPYGSDTSWLVSKSSQSMTVGAAASGKGTYGTWSVSGSSGTTSGVTFTWPRSIVYRRYFALHEYGKYRWGCGFYPTISYSNSWIERVNRPVGSYTSSLLGPGVPSWTHCFANDSGDWERDESGHRHFSMSGGVLISALLGINLSVDSDYSSSRALGYHLVSAGTVCGDNDVPAFASQVKTSR